MRGSKKSKPIVLDTTIGAAGYCNVGRCEAGLFDPSFACDRTDTKPCVVGNCRVHLCDDHERVIDITPTAEVDTNG